MLDDIFATVDAYIFRVLGLVLGAAGCVALLVNNSWDRLSHNIYGLIFLVTFNMLWIYSLSSLGAELIRALAGEKAEKTLPEQARGNG